MENILDNFDDGSPEEQHVELVRFVGDKYAYYLAKWEEIKHNQKISFNFAAAFFGLFWLLYRKMYLESLCLFGIMIVEGFITESLFVEGTNAYKAIDMGLRVAYAVLLGMFGNYLYLKSAERKIEKLKEKGFRGEVLLEEIEKAGGTSTLSVLISIIVIILFVIGVSHMAGLI